MGRSPEVKQVRPTVFKAYEVIDYMYLSSGKVPLEVKQERQYPAPLRNPTSVHYPVSV